MNPVKRSFEIEKYSEGVHSFFGRINRTRNRIVEGESVGLCESDQEDFLTLASKVTGPIINELTGDPCSTLSIEECLKIDMSASNDLNAKHETLRTYYQLLVFTQGLSISQLSKLNMEPIVRHLNSAYRNQPVASD